MTALVTLGNTNLLTFENVCHAVRATYPNDPMAVLLVFDTPESVADNRESKRNRSVREVFPGIEIRSCVTQGQERQTTIPLALAGLLGEMGPIGIVIDLTNGQKADTAVLYAVASISKIGRIHSLRILDKDNLDKSLPQLDYESDWEYVTLESLKEIDAIAQRSFLELLYYQEELKAIGDSLGHHSEDFAQDAIRITSQALEDYFRGATDQARYRQTVATLGILCEDIAKTLYLYLRQSKQTEARVDGFSSYVDQIGLIFRRLRSRDVDWGKEGHFGNQARRILYVDVLLAVAREFRNPSVHPPVYHWQRDEARLMLDMTLLILRRLGDTDVLRVR